ncbi:MAG: amino acid ABC transporter permease [Parachlamydiales bacterium]|nr:amino acid ABC transporter permease [Parachlamydiales bacterium]
MIDFGLFTRSFPALLAPALQTIWITAIALIIGCFMGVLLGVGNCRHLKHPIWSRCITAYVAILRGTPLFVQVLIAYFALPQLIGVNLSPFTAGVIALGLNSSAYIAEIIRGGIDATPTGQWMAAKALGYKTHQVFCTIIGPQVFRNVLPSLVNEATTLLKETSILMVIGVAELTKTGRDIVSRELDPLSVYLAVACVYLLLTGTIAFGASKLEKKRT